MIGTEANTGQEGKCPTCGNVAVEPFCKCEMRRLKAENARLRKVVGTAQKVMDLLCMHKEAIVQHLLDTDDNAGQRLREAIAALDEDKGKSDE